MKILFLIGNPPIDAVSTWDELEIYRDKGIIIPNREFFVAIKALERNTDFENEILKSRENINIPTTGISWKEYFNDYYLKSLTLYLVSESKKYSDFDKNVKKEVQRIKKEMRSMNEYIEDQLEFIIIGGFVVSKGYPIAIQVHPEEQNDDGKYNSISINIHSQISINELDVFIEENKPLLNNLMRKLSKKPNYFISQKALRIVELKDKEGLSHAEIARKINNEFLNSNKKATASSVKQLYLRAKERITSTTTPSKSNK